MKNWIILMKQRWQLLPVLIDIRVCLRIVFSNIIFFFLFCYDTCPFVCCVFIWEIMTIFFFFNLNIFYCLNNDKRIRHKFFNLVLSWIILMKQRWQLLPVLIHIRVCLRIVFSNIIFFFLFCYDTCFKMDIWKWHY
jgi:hypothetical protein